MADLELPMKLSTFYPDVKDSVKPKPEFEIDSIDTLDEMNLNPFSEWLWDNIDESIRITDYLGDGTSGFAVKTDSGRVLKVTKSRDEILLARMLMESQMKHFPKVYWIKEGTQTDKKNYPGIYVYEKEFIPKLSSD